ncbi:MAG: hypothetical protein U9N45_07690, partial [Gemmatimonadota bacterium]|nr:hypothetical protein [Gemmatimonadota bacterium]
RKTPPRGKAPRAGIAAGWLMGCWHWFLAWAGFSGLGFIIGCPYALLDRVGFLGKTGIGGLVGYNVFGFSLTRVFTLDFFYGLGLPLALAAIAGTVFLLSRPRKKVFCLGVILLVSILMLILNASPYMRHFVPLTPFLAVAAAYLLVELYQGRIPLLGGFPPKLALTLAAVVFLYTAGYSAALVSQMGREDNRTACAAWIGENASQYEVIAVAKPEWGSDFYSVDFDDGYYSRVVTGYNYQLLKDYKPDYLILSEYERIDCLMNDEGRGECLVEKLDGSTDFEPVIAFKRDLSILGLPFPYSSPGYDWLYFCPNITLYAPRAGEDSSRTFYLRGRETLDRNDLPGAVGLLRESVELESTNPLYRLWLGRVEMVAAAPSLNAGKTAKAIDYLNRAQQNTQMGLRVAPKTWMRIELLGLQAESRVRLGTLLSENGRMKDAEITLLASLEDMKSQKTAIDSLDNVTLREWDNNYRQVLTTLSYFYIRTKELGKADKWVGEMLQRNENDVQALLLKADLFLRRGGHEREALATIEYVLKLDPSMLDDDKTNLAELVKRLREMVDKLPESQTP